MCGIGGFVSTTPFTEQRANKTLEKINETLKHRGPDGNGTWIEKKKKVGFAHTRLSILDLNSGAQPMHSPSGNVITFNGEIYNFVELRHELGEENFTTTSDTEVILKSYEKWGEECVEHLRGMFAFAIWDQAKQKLFIARDRFGIKPFYYFIEDNVFYFASEVKALLLFKQQAKICIEGLRDYFTFQFCLNQRTLFKDVHQLQPAHCAYIDSDLKVKIRKYWEVHYILDWNHTEKYFVEKLQEKLFDSVKVHLRSDVEVGAYVSGGIDSSLIASLARDMKAQDRFQAFTGKFTSHQGFDESQYAQALAGEKNLLLHQIDINENHFVENFAKVIYHLDFPVAGPGSFPQYMVSGLVKDHLKVVLGGQGGDEIFGGYTRYLIAYFEQCIKGAIDGTLHNGKYIVTYDSIIPNLKSLQNYKPLMQEFWAEGIFDSRDKRYFRLINRANRFQNIINWKIFNGSSSFHDFKEIYWGENVGKESYFDSITHFDFKTLLPALLQVEDRMSMAHGIESRVPFLDHGVIELAATVPSNIKFQNGELKRLLKKSFINYIPKAIFQRKDKMGFPVPLKFWMNQDGKVKDYIMSIFKNQNAAKRFYLTDDFDIEYMMKTEGTFSRNIWALLCLETWQQQFIDGHQPMKFDS